MPKKNNNFFKLEMLFLKILSIRDCYGYEITREFDSCLHFFTNQIAQNVDYINAFEFFLLSNL